MSEVTFFLCERNTKCVIFVTRCILSAGQLNRRRCVKRPAITFLVNNIRDFATRRSYTKRARKDDAKFEIAGSALTIILSLSSLYVHTTAPAWNFRPRNILFPRSTSRFRIVTVGYSCSRVSVQIARLQILIWRMACISQDKTPTETLFQRSTLLFQ